MSREGGAFYRAWRRAVFERDNYKCVKCGSSKGIEADHIIPRAVRPDLAKELSNGQTLCRVSCHIKKTTKDWEKYKDIFLKDKPKVSDLPIFFKEQTKPPERVSPQIYCLPILKGTKIVGTKLFENREEYDKALGEQRAAKSFPKHFK